MQVFKVFLGVNIRFFFLVLLMKYISECLNSKKTPLSSQILGYTPVLNGSSTGYSAKISILKVFGTALKKNHEHATCIDFQLHNLKFSKKGI